MNLNAVLHRAGWYIDNAEGENPPVGQKAPNAFGLYDMLGNVCEWCQNWYAEYPRSCVIDPGGPLSSAARVFRGGAWDFLAVSCQTACRISLLTDFQVDGFGSWLVCLPGQ